MEKGYALVFRLLVGAFIVEPLAVILAFSFRPDASCVPRATIYLYSNGKEGRPGLMAKKDTHTAPITDSSEEMTRRISEFVSSCDGGPFRIYLNLTNGLQAIPICESMGIEPRFVNIQSTALEQKNYDSVIERLGPDVIMDCASGRHVAVIDYGTRKELSRAVYWGVPFVRYSMDRAWYGMEPAEVLQPMRRSGGVQMNIASQLSEAYERKMGHKARAYLRRFKPYAVAGSRGGTDLIGISIPTSHDGDAEWYAGVYRNSGIPVA